MIIKNEKEIRKVLYKKWHSAKNRCHNPNNKQYNNYGGRGIKMADVWLNDFNCFYVDMVSGYKKNLTLERVNNNKGYSKENCRWATQKEQCNNTRRSFTNRQLELNYGKSQSRKYPLTFKNKEYFFDNNQERTAFLRLLEIDLASI